jgi:hypothetical protein
MRLICIIFFAQSLFLSAREKPAKSRPITWSNDIGVMIGGSYYLGELNPSKHFNMSQPAFGVFYRYNPNHRIGYRAAFNYGGIMGDDSQSDDDDQLVRNLNFKNKLMEFSGVVEFNFFDYRINHNKQFFSPYVFLGLAVLKHKPMAEYQGKYVELQPLATEGQGTSLDPDRKKKYKLTQITIPFGIGAKLNLARNVGLSFEWGMRKTFTDYLDDVSKQYVNPVLLAQEKGSLAAQLSDRSLNDDPTFSNVGTQRGNPFIKDWYNFFGFQISVQIHGKPKPCGAYPNKHS